MVRWLNRALEYSLRDSHFRPPRHVSEQNLRRGNGRIDLWKIVHVNVPARPRPQAVFRVKERALHNQHAGVANEIQIQKRAYRRVTRKSHDGMFHGRFDCDSRALERHKFRSRLSLKLRFQLVAHLYEREAQSAPRVIDVEGPDHQTFSDLHFIQMTYRADLPGDGCPSISAHTAIRA